jgi:hypothetical protein
MTHRSSSTVCSCFSPRTCLTSPKQTSTISGARSRRVTKTATNVTQACGFVALGTAGTSLLTFDLPTVSFSSVFFSNFFLKRLRSSCLQTLQKIRRTGEMSPFTRSPAVFCLSLLPFPFKDASPRHFSLKPSFPIYVTEITCAKSFQIFLFLLLAQFNRN